MTDPTGIAARVLDFLKSPNRAHFVLWVGSGALLFLPEVWLEALQVAGVRDYVEPFAGPLFFLLSVLFVAVGVEAGWKGAKKKRAARKAKECREARLGTLTPREIEVLRYFIFNETRGQQLSWQSAVVRGLEAERILVRVTEAITAGEDPFTGEVSAYAGYQLQPWAWDFLTEHPELLGLDPEPRSR